MTQRSRTNADTGEARSSRRCMASRDTAGCSKYPRASRRSSPSRAQLKMPGDSASRVSVSAGSSRPRNVFVSTRTMNLDASAPEASVNRAPSFVRITNLVGSRPVQVSRYFRSIVIESSPEMESNRSTATDPSALDRRASEIRPSGQPISGDSPKFVVNVASVEPRVASPKQSGQHTTDGALARPPGPDRHEDLLLRRVPGQDVSENFRERVDRGRVVARRLAVARRQLVRVNADILGIVLSRKLPQ